MVGIYCRISKVKEEGKDVSIEVQQKMGTEFAVSMGENYRVFIDEGKSGTTDKISERPQFVRLLDAIKVGEVTIVYCYDQSRIERSNRIWNLFLSIMLDNDCKYYPGGKFVDLDSPENKLFTGIISLTNEFYAALTGMKVKETTLTNARKGKTHGLCAYGYQKDKNGYFEINKQEEAVVKRMYQLSNEGVGTYTIARMLNADGIPTKFNSFSGSIHRKENYTEHITTFEKSSVRWRGNVVYDIITNPIYKGTRMWNGEPMPVPKIIEKDLWQKVNDHLANNKKNVGKREEYHYLLNGLMFCADCGNMFKGKKRLKGNDNAYKCKGKSRQNIKCGSRGISLPKVETFIINHLFIAKDLQKHLSQLSENKADVDTLKSKLAKTRKELERTQLAEKRVYDLLFDPEYKEDIVVKERHRAIKKTILNLNETVNILENKLIEKDVHRRNNRLNNAIGNFSLDMGFDQIKKLVHSLIQRITIKHNMQDGSRSGYYLVEIEYRGYDEIAVYMTNWQGMTWNLLSYYRSRATNPAELAEDKEILESLAEMKGVKINIPDDFKGLESTGASYQSTISLKKEDLILFD